MMNFKDWIQKKWLLIIKILVSLGFLSIVITGIVFSINSKKEDIPITYFEVSIIEESNKNIKYTTEPQMTIFTTLNQEVDYINDNNPYDNLYIGYDTSTNIIDEVSYTFNSNVQTDPVIKSEFNGSQIQNIKLEKINEFESNELLIYV